MDKIAVIRHIESKIKTIKLARTEYSKNYEKAYFDGMLTAYLNAGLISTDEYSRYCNSYEQDRICSSCGEKMKKEVDTDEPIIIYRCSSCTNIEFERTNGYEG